MFFIFMYFAKPRAEQVAERECVISLKNLESCLKQTILLQNPNENPKNDQT